MTHKEQAKRREAIIDDLKNGESVASIAKTYGLQTSTIYNFRKQAGLPSTPAPTKTSRLADYYRKNGLDGIEQEIERLGLTRGAGNVVLMSKFGVKLPRKTHVLRSVLKTSRVFSIIAALQKGATASDKWGAKLGCTRQYIELVQRQCEQEGVKLFNKEANK